MRAAVDGVYDWVYEGHGNWPFNTAYAAARGLEASVARFRSLAEAEPWIAAGVPVGMSYAWKPGMLTGAPVSQLRRPPRRAGRFRRQRRPGRQRPGRQGRRRPPHLPAGGAGERVARPFRRDGLPGLPAGLVDSLEPLSRAVEDGDHGRAGKPAARRSRAARRRRTPTTTRTPKRSVASPWSSEPSG